MELSLVHWERDPLLEGVEHLDCVHAVPQYQVAVVNASLKKDLVTVKMFAALEKNAWEAVLEETAPVAGKKFHLDVLENVVPERVKRAFAVQIVGKILITLMHSPVVEGAVSAVLLEKYRFSKKKAQ